MHLFYKPDLSQKQLVLGPDESKHIVRSLRLQTNDTVHLTDGNGTLARAHITDNNSKACTLEVYESEKHEKRSDYNLHIAIAPTKNINRFEWFLEKATETGIDEITPLRCANSERKHLNAERLQKIMIAAMKQSGGIFLPRLNPMQAFEQFILSDLRSMKYLAYAEEHQKDHLKDVYPRGEDCLILVGPEGDFDQNELELAKENGFSTISLGRKRLRTETAGIVACIAINLINE